ncbi:DUF1345 domain-containing protein [Novosphingobium sp. KACC 22771]|uniref:DUF1345 domain-containing protein n=1 Tax=Novosphingobium sp. KACC 22771 TaxID=3025670 RepID=UPI00236562BE|nr:DUF1345 domain-containing protein [Novosphingobium sp. KACC 22771]WDF72354.1 DUF1345 domain-containing protein [Novosphingobium sp. KACC 22771]
MEKRAGLRWPLPARFLLFLGLFAAATGLLGAQGLRWGQAVLGGFDTGALVFIASLWPLSRDTAPDQMRRHARQNDVNRFAVLVISAMIMLVIVTALFVDLPHARDDTGYAKGAALVLIIASLVIAWLFSNLIYTLHYAHIYFAAKQGGGLRFPGPDDDNSPSGSLHCPNFWDFFYFALTIGMAFATSDVEITSPRLRRVATVHGALAFFYNLVVLAFTINVTAGS